MPYLSQLPPPCRAHKALRGSRRTRHRGRYDDFGLVPVGAVPDVARECASCGGRWPDAQLPHVARLQVDCYRRERTGAAPEPLDCGGGEAATPRSGGGCGGAGRVTRAGGARDSSSHPPHKRSAHTSESPVVHSALRGMVTSRTHARHWADCPSPRMYGSNTVTARLPV